MRALALAVLLVVACGPVDAIDEAHPELWSHEPCEVDPVADPCGVECSGLTFDGCACALECPRAPRGYAATCDLDTGRCGAERKP